MSQSIRFIKQEKSLNHYWIILVIMLIKTTKEMTLSLSFLQRCRSCLVSICWKFEALFNRNKIFYYYMDYGEENFNDLFLLIYKISDHIQRPIKILIFFADLPVYLSDRHSGGIYQYSIAVSSLCICICLWFSLMQKQTSVREVPNHKVDNHISKSALVFLNFNESLRGKVHKP